MSRDEAKRALRKQIRALFTQHSSVLAPHELLETLSEASQEWLASEGVATDAPAGPPSS